MISVEVLESGRIIHASQDRNKEFFFLFVYIYTDNTAFLSTFIYKNDSRLL